MGTTISIDIVDSCDRSIVDELVEWFHEVDAVFSPFKDDSTITRIGRGEVGADDACLTNDVLEVLHCCERLHDDTLGVFDVWDLPSPNGTRFDPCGYVKGWSVERARQLLAGHGVQHFCINAGGDLALGGHNHDGRPWRIGVRRPDRDEVALVLAGVGPMGIATSGSYERGAHIHDPRTGLPSTEVGAVTVVGPSLAEADAYATTLYVMGLDGLAWLDRHPAYGGCLMTWDEQLFTNDRFEQFVAS